MAKKEKPPTLEELDARVRALECHNGWTPGQAPAEPPPPPAEPGDAGDAGDDKLQE